MTSIRPLSIVFLAFILLLNANPAKSQNEFNAIVGDSGYYHTFGHWPKEDTPDQIRITAHLLWVHDRLARQSVAHLSPEVRERRANALDLLQAYIQRGKFPRNNRMPGRLPIFVDESGTHCAVGYLIRETAGDAAVRPIVKANNEDKLLDMDPELVRPWADANGFTLRELAMIQPSYGCPIPSCENCKDHSLSDEVLTWELARPDDLDGGFVLDVRFSVVSTLVKNVEFSNWDFPRLNWKIRRKVNGLKFAESRCFAGERIDSHCCYTIRLIFPAPGWDKTPRLPREDNLFLGDPYVNFRKAFAPSGSCTAAESAGYKIQGTLKQHDTWGGNIIGGQVTLLDAAGNPLGSVETTVKGHFSLSVSDPQRVEFVHFSSDGFAPLVIPVAACNRFWEIYLSDLQMDFTNSRGVDFFEVVL